MNSKIFNFNHAKLFFLVIVFALGLFFVLKPENNSVANIEKGSISITVIELKKEPLFSINKILGVILILSSIAGYYFTSNRLTKENNRKIELTPQEKNIYQLIKQGYSNKEIASELNVSVSTIKTHINNIYKKEGISSRKEITDNENIKG